MYFTKGSTFIVRVFASLKKRHETKIEFTSIPSIEFPINFLNKLLDTNKCSSVLLNLRQSDASHQSASSIVWHHQIITGCRRLSQSPRLELDHTARGYSVSQIVFFTEKVDLDRLIVGRAQRSSLLTASSAPCRARVQRNEGTRQGRPGRARRCRRSRRRDMSWPTCGARLHP
jgi:hypothetical protein